MMLLFVELEFEYFVSIRFNTDNIDRTIGMHQGLQLKSRHERLYHLEIHDAEQKVNDVLRHIDDF